MAAENCIVNKNANIFKTKPGTEFLMSLSPSKHLSKTVEAFGVTEDTHSDIIIAFISSSNEQDNNVDQLEQVVQGTPSSLDNLSQTANVMEISRAFNVEANDPDILSTILTKASSKYLV
ncbi:hypothetical protein GEMRC1_001918 [Eukaryota sp. GEM-RC1]